MKIATLLRIKEPSVCHEVIDGEVVVVDFDSGDYYSMVGSAALIWGALANGASIEQVWARLGLTDPDARRQTAGFPRSVVSCASAARLNADPLDRRHRDQLALDEWQSVWVFRDCVAGRIGSLRCWTTHTVA